MSGTYQAVYHTHTWRCQHAEGDVADYARMARDGGCLVMGASDHMPTPDGRWHDWRMSLAQLDGYLAAITQARREVDDMTILASLECEYVPEWDRWYRDELLGRIGCDYLIGAVHLAPIDGAWKNSFDGLKTAAHLRAYVDHAVLTMESGLFAFIAHPDAFAGGWLGKDRSGRAAARDIAQAAAQLGIPLELNALGLRKPPVGKEGGQRGWGRRAPYPWIPFWEEAAGVRGLQVVLSSDAHRPRDVIAGHGELCALRDRFGLVEAAAIRTR